MTIGRWIVSAAPACAGSAQGLNDTLLLERHVVERRAYLIALKFAQDQNPAWSRLQLDCQATAPNAWCAADFGIGPPTSRARAIATTSTSAAAIVFAWSGR